VSYRPPVDVGRYVESVRERVQLAGFRQETPPKGAILKARRREAKLTRFGIVETVVVISDVYSQPSPDQFRAFGSDSVRSALEGKSRIPRGLGSSLVVYPVVIGDGISDELIGFVRSYVPKHWAIVEFPVALDLRSSSLVLLQTRPFWGAAYYSKTRRDAYDLLAPAP